MYDVKEHTEQLQTIMTHLEYKRDYANTELRRYETKCKLEGLQGRVLRQILENADERKLTRQTQTEIQEQL